MGSLIDSFGARAVYGMGKGDQVKVESFIQDGNWLVPDATTNRLIQIRLSDAARSSAATRV